MKPSAPKPISRSWASENRHEMRTSLPRAKSATESAITAPFASNRRRISSRRAYTLTSWPAPSNRSTIGSPSCPAPRNPTVLGIALSSAPRQVQRVHTEHLTAVLDRLSGNLVIGNALVPLLQDHRQLLSGEVRTEAPVRAATEGQVTCNAAVEVDRAGIVVGRFVPPCERQRERRH